MNTNFVIRTTMSASIDRKPLVAVLAAGRATRFGGGKLDANCAGMPLGQWTLDAVAQAGLSAGVIVVGPQPPVFAQAAAGWSFLTNPAPEEGLGPSVSLACQKAAAQSRDVLILLADMPLVTPDHLRALVSCRSCAATRYPDGRVGVPALIAASDVGSFTSLSGDSGAGKLLSCLDALEVFDAPPDTLLDVDDAEALGAVGEILAAR